MQTTLVDIQQKKQFPTEDENFVINLIEEIKLFLLRKALTPNGAMSTTNHNINKKQAKNDVINQSGYIAQQTTLFA